MGVSNYTKGRRTAGFLKLCLAIIVSLSIVMGGIALTPGPVQATGITPAGPVTYNLPVCIPWQQQFAISPTCPPGSTIFYWLVGSTPAWVNLDANTGLLTACPVASAAGTSISFQVWCTEMTPFPFCLGFATANVTLNFLANPPPCVTTILPVYYPVAWENFPFAMTLSATGGVGPFTWSAAGLPPGLTVTDPVNGIISGIPAPGSCGIYTVTVTVVDAGTCSSCCPTISRPFILIVDCYANYVFAVISNATYDFNVVIGPGLTSGQTTLLINGQPKGTLTGGGSQTYTSPLGQSNMVSVDQTVPGPDPQTRFSVKGSNEILVNEGNTAAYFDYAREVLIETGSNPAGIAQPSGAGFCVVGSNFNTTAPSPIDGSGQQGVKYLFKQWTLPDGSTNPNRDLLFVVGNAGKVIAGYDTYYLLTVVSDYPAVTESSWELKDSTATYDLALRDVPIPNFWGAIGGMMKPVNGSGTHLMTGPGTVKIAWTNDYTVPIIIIVVIVLLVVGLVVFLTLRRKKPGASAVSSASATQSPPSASEAGKTASTAAVTDEKTVLHETGSSDRPNFCPNCGAPVDKDAEFCKKCGTKLVKEDKK
jgi:zinc-ribbon domain/Putative Ig domain